MHETHYLYAACLLLSIARLTLSMTLLTIWLTLSIAWLTMETPLSEYLISL